MDMVIRVKLFASFQEVAGRGEVEMDADSVRSILDQLADSFPGLEGEIFTDESRSRLRGRVKVMVNGRNIEFLHDLDTRIMEGDRVAVFPPIAGG